MSALGKIRILLIEDSEHDAELAQIVLERSGYQPLACIVHDRAGMQEALANQGFDVILSDFVLPAFSGTEALKLAAALAPATPFIFFSGVFGETHAVEMMRLGATDYVLKQNLSLLPKAVGRALTEVFERQERQRIEAQLSTVELHSRLAIDAARLGMWDMEPVMGRMVWDDRCKELFGMGADDHVPEQPFIGPCHPDDRARMLRAVEKAISSEDYNDYHEQYRVLLPDGKVRWVSTRGRAIFQQGRCVRFIGVLMDITSEKLATQALEAQNEALGERVQERTRERDRTWDVSRDMLAVCHFDTQPVILNPAWEDILGWRREELLQRPLLDLVHPDDIPNALLLIERMERGEVTHQFTNRIRHADGGWRWISWMAVPDNDMAYIAGRDITRDIAAVEELAAANRKLTEQIEERERVEAALRQMQRLEAVGQLTAGVAHDFNNLLVVILSNAALLQREVSVNASEGLRQRLQSIREAGERGAKLTGQLLAFSRRQQLEPKPLDLNETIRSMSNLLQSTLGGNIRVETSLQADVRYAMADPTQLELIVLNLAINGRDAMPNGGVLRLATRNCTLVDNPRRAEDPEPGDYIALSVQDTGTGMTPDVLAKAFEPFFTTKDVGKGSGLGLPQVFGFAKQTGGGAAISSDPKQGTTVTVYLPYVESAGEPPVTALQPTPQATQGPSRTVLLVDDDPGVREVTCIMLEDAGCQVLQAENGRAALDIVHGDSPIDVLLTDFAMPGMNGAELAHAARQHRPNLPVVFVTGYADLDAFEIGDALILQKPFHESDLCERIGKACAAAPGRCPGSTP